MTILTQPIAEQLAKLDRNYVARERNGAWFVWCSVADHVVEFDQRLVDQTAAEIAARPPTVEIIKPRKYVARVGGQIIGKRKSQRTYTHAIAVRTDNGHVVVAWSGRLDLAQAEARRRGPLAIIIPAETI
jgi:hypothetical protein